jgi:hypothetical protein
MEREYALYADMILKNNLKNSKGSVENIKKTIVITTVLSTLAGGKESHYKTY